jgi:hypothetical protein
MRAHSIIIIREMFPRWSGIVGAIRNRGQGNSTMLAQFANLDGSACWSFLTTRDIFNSNKVFAAYHPA